MAHFIPLDFPGDSGQTIFVNADRITYMREPPNTRGKTSIFFDGGQSVTVAASAQEIAEQCRRS